MKRNLLRAFAFATFTAMAMTVQAQQETSVTTPDVDTYVRLNNAKAHGGETTIELQTYTNTEDASKSTDFVGLMTFSYAAPQNGYKIKSATLRLTTERIKGDRNINIYAFDGTVADDSKYEDLADAIAAARATDVIGTCKLEGQNGKSIVSDEITAEKYQDITAWQNEIDLTSYVKGLSTSSFTIMIARNADANNSNKIFTKEVADFTNAKNESWSISAADCYPQLTVEYEEDANSVTSTNTSIADTYVRMNNTKDHGSETTVEIKTYTDEADASQNQDFVALYSFAIPADALDTANYDLKSATVRLVTERIKAGRTMNVYAYPYSYEESTTYETESANVAAARAAGTILTFDAAGPYNKSMVSDQIDDDKYKTVDGWTNTLDVTEAVKAMGSTTFSIMIESSKNNKNAEKFFTKEATDVTNAKDATLTFAAADLVPTITIAYEKKSATGISEVKNTTNTAKGIYTLQGVKVNGTNQSGIFIINGKKVIK